MPNSNSTKAQPGDGDKPEKSDKTDAPIAGDKPTGDKPIDDKAPIARREIPKPAQYQPSLANASLTIPGGAFYVNNVLVDCDGKKLPDDQVDAFADHLERHPLPKAEPAF